MAVQINVHPIRAHPLSDEPLTIHDAATALQRGSLRPGDLVEQCLARIAGHEDRVRAWVLVDEVGARQQAEQAGNEIARGVYRGALHGIPIGIKDIIDVAGFPTRAGSSITDPRPAEGDAAVVARLRKAGAIILGKTVTTEFASFDPPVTRNPWNLDRTPGGSSSGSAAAVAGGMCLGAIGSQTGGSITRPASYCGIAGCKPTYGRVSLAGIVPLAFGLDHPGPMARTVADLAVLLAAIAGADERDPLAADAAVPDYAATLDERPKPRLGLVETFFMEQAEPAIRDAVMQTCARLTAAGARVDRAALPGSFGEVVEMHMRLMAGGAADFHRHWFPARRAEYGPKIASLLDRGLALPAIDYAAAVAHQALFKRQVLASLDDCDALIMPATRGTAPGRETTGDPSFNSPWSYSGLPVVSIPVALDSEGMPLCVQLVGRPFEEAALLAVAAWCEAAIAFDAMPSG
jgi:Asp-tRNA(Asn)/Glu-tRNA(Gln) amidotransferase A subunit family amidase